MANSEDFPPIFCLTADFLPEGGGGAINIGFSCRGKDTFYLLVSMIYVKDFLGPPIPVPYLFDICVQFCNM